MFHCFISSDHFLLTIEGKHLNNTLFFFYQDPPEYEMLPFGGSSNISKMIEVTSDGKTSECTLEFHEQTAYSLILSSVPTTTGIECKVVSVPQKGLQNTFFSPALKMFLTK